MHGAQATHPFYDIQLERLKWFHPGILDQQQQASAPLCGTLGNSRNKDAKSSGRFELEVPQKTASPVSFKGSFRQGKLLHLKYNHMYKPHMYFLNRRKRCSSVFLDRDAIENVGRSLHSVTWSCVGHLTFLDPISRYQWLSPPQVIETKKLPHLPKCPLRAPIPLENSSNCGCTMRPAGRGAAVGPEVMALNLGDAEHPVKASVQLPDNP